MSRIASWPLGREAAVQILEELSTWAVHAPEARDVIEAAGIQEEHQTAFWDAMIVQSAFGLECRRIWSEDLNPGQSYRTIELVNPFAG